MHNAGIRVRSLPETEPRDARMENFIGNLSITHRTLQDYTFQMWDNWNVRIALRIKSILQYCFLYFWSTMKCKYILFTCSSFCYLYFWETLFSMRACTIVLLVEPVQWYIGLVNKHNRANIVMIFLFLLFSLFSFYYCTIVIGGGSGILV